MKTSLGYHHRNKLCRLITPVSSLVYQFYHSSHCCAPLVCSLPSCASAPKAPGAPSSVRARIEAVLRRQNRQAGEAESEEDEDDDDTPPVRKPAAPAPVSSIPAEKRKLCQQKLKEAGAAASVEEELFKAATSVSDYLTKVRQKLQQLRSA